MDSNITNVVLSDTIDNSIVFSIFLFSVSISILLSIIIIILIISTKNLYTPTNLLVCNTSITTGFYITMAIVKLTVFYNKLVLSNSWCKIQAYLSYVCLHLLMYSYVIQAISRLFFTIFYKHRYLLSYKCHILLIVCQIIISFSIPLSCIITDDIYFRPLKLCIVSMKYLFYVFYLYTFSFFIPLIVTIVIYIMILRLAIRSSLNVHQSWYRFKRDVTLVRNILIIFTIFIFAELPTTIYTILSIRLVPTSSVFYMFAATAPPISTVFEKISVILLNNQIRREIRKRWSRLCYDFQLNSNRIQPLA